MSASEPLLSIVVPTRDRPDYALPCIRGILRLEGPELEVVVEDNSRDPVLESSLGAIGDDRLRYRWIASPRSMSENFDAAVARAKGEYVAIVGDDDGVNPEILAAAQWARRENVDSLSSSTPAHYVWPDLKMPQAGAMGPSEVRLYDFSGSRDRVDPPAELGACLARAGLRFSRLPRPYYGLVRRTCYEQVREIAGTCFPGVSPDLAGAVALAEVVRESWHVDYPLFLPGSSARSNAGLSGLKKHVGELRDQRHLPRNCMQEWSSIVPAFYSVETVWAESVVGALNAMGRRSQLREFNSPYLYAVLLVFYPSYRPRVLRQFASALRATEASLAAGVVRTVAYVGSLWLLRAKFLAHRVLRWPARQPTWSRTGAVSILEAVDQLVEHLAFAGRRFPA